MSTTFKKPRMIAGRALLIALVTVGALASVGACPGSLAADARPRFETRCGWFDNPTPGNVWLYDRDGEWTIGVQGGYQVEREWDFPEFEPGQWVETNAGSHGYGCACLRLRVDKRTRRVLEIESARARPLAACRRDPKLKRWEQKLD